MIKVGERLGRFELLRELGRGSHGVVFEATDTLLNERVAIKALQPWLSGDPTLRERFKRELILTRRVAHPGVCRLFDLHEEGEAFFISMQFVEGRPLSALLREDAPPIARIIRLLRGVCGALAAAHAQGVVHRDLKPANVMVDAKDNVVVLDFGIATATGVGQLTRPGQALGSVPFIPPEVWEGEPASPMGDQYALGVIGFAAGTGTLPYRGQNPLEVVDAIRASQPTLRERNAAIDPAYEAVILKAMARKPADRFVDISALDEALAALQTPSQAALTTRTTSLSGLRGVGLPAPVTLSEATKITPPPAPPPANDLSVAQLDELAPTPRRPDEMEPLTMESGIIALPTREGPALAATVPLAEPATTLPGDDGTAHTVEVETIKIKEIKTELVPRLERPLEPTVLVRRDDVAGGGADDPLLPKKKPLALYAAAAAGLVAVVAIAVVVSGGDDAAVADAGSVAVADADAGSAVADVGSAVAGSAVADAGSLAVVAAVDAGSVAEAVVDAGAATYDAADLDLPALETVDAEARRTKRPPDPVLLVQLDARGRGVRPGDVPGYDAAIARARATSDKAAREKAAAEAKKILSAVVVDKAFVGRKLAIFNGAFDKAPVATQNKVKPISKDVLQRFSAGDWKGANARLNDGFAQLQKK